MNLMCAYRSVICPIRFHWAPWASASVSLGPSALTEPSQCDSKENVPGFQTLRFNVQAHQSRTVIYWLKLELHIHIRIVAAALVSQRAALQQHIVARGESLEVWWLHYGEETLIKTLRLFVACSFGLLTSSCTDSVTHLMPHKLNSFPHRRCHPELM